MRAVAATALSTRQGRRMGGRVAGLFRRRIGLPPMLARTPLAFVGCMGRMHPWRYVVSQQQLVSLEELGSALALNIAWCAPMCVRHSFIREAAGGRSAMLGEFLKFLLISPSGMSTAWGSAGARKVRVPRSLQVYIGVCRVGAACAQRCSGMARAGPTTMYSLGGASAFDVVASVPDTLASGPDDGGIDYVEITCSQPRRFCA